MALVYIHDLTPELTTSTLLNQASPAEEAPEKEVAELRATLYQRLGWGHWARAERSCMRHCFPPGYPLF
jgi:hypothetical protein